MTTEPFDFETTGHSFVKLALPDLEHIPVFHLSDNVGMGIGPGEEAIAVLDLTQQNFPSADAFEAAKKASTLWFIDYYQADDDYDMPEKKCAGSLQDLLGGLGDPPTQALALEAYQRFFQGITLAYNDHLHAGHPSVAELLKNDHNLFAHNRADEAVALEKEQVWSMVDQFTSKTLWAASSLTGVLALAWENSPTVAPLRRAKAMDRTLPPAKQRSAPRF